MEVLGWHVLNCVEKSRLQWKRIKSTGDKRWYLNTWSLIPTAAPSFLCLGKVPPLHLSNVFVTCDQNTMIHRNKIFSSLCHVRSYLFLNPLSSLRKTIASVECDVPREPSHSISVYQNYIKFIGRLFMNQQIPLFTFHNHCLQDLLTSTAALLSFIWPWHTCAWIPGSVPSQFHDIRQTTQFLWEFVFSSVKQGK